MGLDAPSTNKQTSKLVFLYLEHFIFICLDRVNGELYELKEAVGRFFVTGFELVLMLSRVGSVPEASLVGSNLGHSLTLGYWGWLWRTLSSVTQMIA